MSGRREQKREFSKIIISVVGAVTIIVTAFTLVAAIFVLLKALPYGLILVPSDSFGLPGYFRIAFCTDTEKVVRSIDAFKAFVKAEY